MQGCPEIVRDLFLALGVGMNQVGLVELRVPGDTFEEKWAQHRVVLGRHLRENGFEGAGEIRAHAQRHFHGHQNQRHVGHPLFCPLENGGKVLRGLCRGKSAEAVVAPQCNHKHRRSFAQDPVDPAEPSGCGVAADACVDDFKRESRPVDLFLEVRRVVLCRVQTVSGGEAVPEKHDAQSRGLVCMSGIARP